LHQSGRCDALVIAWYKGKKHKRHTVRRNRAEPAAIVVIFIVPAFRKSA
jgi:hypothetical protein